MSGHVYPQGSCDVKWNMDECRQLSQSDGMSYSHKLLYQWKKYFRHIVHVVHVSSSSSSRGGFRFSPVLLVLPLGNMLVTEGIILTLCVYKSLLFLNVQKYSQRAQENTHLFTWVHTGNLIVKEAVLFLSSGGANSMSCAVTHFVSLSLPHLHLFLFVPLFPFPSFFFPPSFS